MITKIRIYDTDCVNPYQNIALEEYLLEHVEDGECILYLWQNQNTVVIGRNQNALDECRIAKLEGDGGHVARRLSGGGAVYHDLGNLNFTFLVKNDDYDVNKQTDVILEAVKSLGIEAQRNGRNDILANGCKFSGHAYYKSKERCYHHGTLMVNVKKDELGKYLSPSKDKLESKGVASVRSRVVNLMELAEDLTIEKMKESLKSAFGKIYRLEPTEYVLDDNAARTVEERRQFFESEEWLYRIKGQGEKRLQRRFDWGGVVLCFTMLDNRFEYIEIASDGLEADYLDNISKLLIGVSFDKTQIQAKLMQQATNEVQKQIAEDLSELITQEE